MAPKNQTDHSSSNGIAIVSPFTHLAGHYWPYTVDTATAVAKEGVDVTFYAALPPRENVFPKTLPLEWRSCCPWTPFLQSIEQRNLHWGSRSDTLLRNLEFSLCLRSALKSDTASHIHCIEARHRLLLNAVLRTRRSFSVLCVGSPDSAALGKRAKTYRKAFGTGRLKFIVETEAVRRDWEPLAGEHVIHIPAALNERTESILEKREARRRLNLPEEAFICLFFGTHREGKDYRTAIEAAKLAKSHPHLLFAGPLISGNDPDALLKDLQYDNATSWKEYYPDESVSTLFDACDVVMLPYAEGYVKGSGVLLQACKYGKPVIATDTGHLADFVNSHHSGMTYRPGDPKSLAEVYDRMAFADSEISRKFSEAITQTRDQYLWSTLVKRYLEVVESAKDKI